MAARRYFQGSAQSLQVANGNIVRSSVGAGLTWASPFGALTVNYAVPLTKASYDVVQPLSFGAGAILRRPAAGLRRSGVLSMSV